MEKILIIEDNEDIMENTAELLELSHYEVYRAADAQNGIRMAAAHRPDLIICEEMLRGQDFPIFLGSARQDRRISQIPIVIISPGDNPEYEETAAGRLNKPFSDEQLYSVVQQVLQSRNEASSANEVQA